MNQTKKLGQKVALVTGSSKGIGAGIALELAQAGASVCINYSYSSADADKLVDQIQSYGCKAIAVRANVSDREQVLNMVQACESALGPLDILVTNAVASVRNSILETRFEDLQKTVEIGIYGVFHTIQIVAQRMIEQKRKGVILHVSSPHARVPFKDAIDYNVAKAGSHQLVLSAANELMWNGIRVNILEPGWTDTPGERTWYSDEVMNEMGKKMPLGRMGMPADLGKAAVFLASDDADYITGTVLRVDGGQFIEGGPSWESKGRHGE